MHTHTRALFMRMTGSFAQFCLWVLSRRVSPRAADERAGCSSVSLPRAPENVNTLSCNTSEARYTHTHAYTHKQRGEISSNHIPQTWDIFIRFFYINKQLILTSMKFQGGEHSSTYSWLIRFRFFHICKHVCQKNQNSHLLTQDDCNNTNPGKWRVNSQNKSLCSYTLFLKLSFRVAQHSRY